MRTNSFEEHSIQQALAAADDHLLSIQRAIRAGVTLVNGTDYPPGDLVDGVPAAVHEVLLMAGAGLTTLQALQSVSSQAADCCGSTTTSDRSGRGHVGDLIAVDGDPLDDLSALRHIRSSSKVNCGSGRSMIGLSPPDPFASNRFRDGAVWEPLAGYSRGARRGNVIAVSGTTAPGGAELYPGDTYGQLAAALAKVVEAVQALGGSRSDISAPG